VKHHGTMNLRPHQVNQPLKSSPASSDLSLRALSCTPHSRPAPAPSCTTHAASSDQHVVNAIASARRQINPTQPRPVSSLPCFTASLSALPASVPSLRRGGNESLRAPPQLTVGVESAAAPSKCRRHRRWRRRDGILSALGLAKRMRCPCVAR
jgi:hypothetical protein